METIHRYLVLSGWIWHTSDREFAVAVITLAASAAIAVAAAGGSLASSVAVGIVVGSAAIYAPVFAARVRAERAEADLPYVLHSVASEVEAGIDFNTALKNASRLSPVLGAEIRKVLSMYARGVPMDRALRSVGESFASDSVQRAFLHIALLYQSGSEATALKRMADEMLAVQKAESKKFSSELAMFTLIFVAIAALVPALFAMYILIGSTVIDMGMSAADVRLVFLGAFPVGSALALTYMYARLPAYMRR